MEVAQSTYCFVLAHIPVKNDVILLRSFDGVSHFSAAAKTTAYPLPDSDVTSTVHVYVYDIREFV